MINMPVDTFNTQRDRERQRKIERDRETGREGGRFCEGKVSTKAETTRINLHIFLLQKEV